MSLILLNRYPKPTKRPHGFNMITKRTDKKVKRARSEIAGVLYTGAFLTNRLKGYEENGLRAILTSLDKWIKAHGRPEERKGS